MQHHMFEHETFMRNNRTVFTTQRVFCHYFTMRWNVPDPWTCPLVTLPVRVLKATCLCLQTLDINAALLIKIALSPCFIIVRYLTKCVCFQIRILSYSGLKMQLRPLKFTFL